MLTTLVTILVMILVVAFFLVILQKLLALMPIPSNIQTIILLIIGFVCLVYGIKYCGLLPQF